MRRPLPSALITQIYGTFVLTLLGLGAITVVADCHTFPAGAGLGLGVHRPRTWRRDPHGVATVAQVSRARFNPAVTMASAP